MKIKLLMVGIFLLSLTAKAQDLPVDSKSGKITFMKTVDAKGLSAQQLYDIAKEWAGEKGFGIVENKPGARLVLQGKCETEYPATKSTEKLKGAIEFKFQFDSKEGKYRYILIDFKHKGQPEDAGALEDREPDCGFTKISSRSWIVIKKSTHKEVIKLLEELKKKITAVQNDPTKNDDW